MKELDIVLEAYARATLPAATPAERAALAELLALPDPLLAAWLLNGQDPVPGGLRPLIGRIRTLCRSGPHGGRPAGGHAGPRW